MVFDILEEDIQKILSADPKAYIFPRINLDMPEWWEAKYFDELNQLVDGTTLRQSFSSKQWRKDAGLFLQELISVLQRPEYINHIIGYQLSAGTTEEWFYHGWPEADFSKSAFHAYRQWHYEKYNVFPDTDREG